MIGGDTIEIVKRTDNGDTYIPVAGCSFQVADTTEDTTYGIITVWAKVYLPATTDAQSIAPRDAIRFNGKTYEVHGAVVVATDLDGQASHVRCTVERVSG